MPQQRRSLRRTATALCAAAATVLAGLALASPARASDVVTPGDFTGYGFDQCVAPTQSAMNTWLRRSPFWAVGIYISGDSRGCPSQPNLTPRWIDTQLENGWRLLPITLGPQAWCTTRERYLHQVRIKPSPHKGYRKARSQGRAEAAKTVGVARSLGIPEGSTLWYDLEAFDTSPRNCRESALSFLNAWTFKLHELGYVSGVYSSAASGMRMLDDARVNRPGKYRMPDQVWIADWNGRADARSTYIRGDGWMPHARVHQYRGGHNERHGGVTINIDRNWLDLGSGSQARKARRYCGGIRFDFGNYKLVRPGAKGDLVTAAQCALRKKGFYDGPLTGRFDGATGSAAAAYRASVGLPSRRPMSRSAWTSILSRGRNPLMKYGSTGNPVRRLQRALNAADRAHLRVSGVFEQSTTAALRAYQADHGMYRTGVVTRGLWDRLHAGQR